MEVDCNSSKLIFGQDVQKKEALLRLRGLNRELSPGLSE